MVVVEAAVLGGNGPRPGGAVLELEAPLVVLPDGGRRLMEGTRRGSDRRSRIGFSTCAGAEYVALASCNEALDVDEDDGERLKLIGTPSGAPLLGVPGETRPRAVWRRSRTSPSGTAEESVFGARSGVFLDATTASPG